MEAQIAQFTNRGMNQDISVSKATNEFAFKNYNIRITAVNDNTLLSITNEKLPKTNNVNINKLGLINNKISINYDGLDYSLSFIAAYPVKTTLQIAVAIEYDSSDGTSSIGHHERIATILEGETISSSVLVGDGSYTNIRIASIKRDNKYAYYLQGYDDEPNYKEVSYDYIIGDYRGHAILSDYLILFTHSKDTSLDYIYRLEISDDTITGIIKYEGDLNLGEFVETLPYYESEEIQKVYWVDGVNQTRLVNIKPDTTIYGNGEQFNFNPSIAIFPKVKITKEYKTLGNFSSGVIQYFISYYNKYGAETAIVWASDLQYITDYSRGASPDETLSCNFKLEISNIDASYEYIRVYSMQRTSINAEPICNLVQDIPINNAINLTVIDTNNYNEIISPTMLLFLGGSDLIASTLTQKDNTLFLGNLKTSESNIVKNVKDLFTHAYNFSTYESNIISFNKKLIGNVNSSSYQLNDSEENIKTFKSGEIYRFALQFQDNKGVWSQPLWIGDKESNIRPEINNNGDIYVSTAVVNLNEETRKTISKYYSNYRLLIAEPTNADRKVLAQGILNPTVFNYADRVKETGPYAQASWILRPRGGKAAFEHLKGLGNKVEFIDDNLTFTNLETCEIQNSLNKPPVKLKIDQAKNNYLISFDIKNFVVEVVGMKYFTCNCSVLKIDGNDIHGVIEVQQEILKDDMFRGITKACEIMLSRVFDVLNITEEELQMSVPILEDYLLSFLGLSNNNGLNISSAWDTDSYSLKKKNSWSVVANGTNNRSGCVRILNTNSNLYPIESYENNYYVDSNIVTFHSPEIEGNETLFDEAKLAYRIIGVLPINRIESDVDLQLNTSGIASNYKIDSYSNKNEMLLNTPLYKDNPWTDAGNLNNSTLVSYYIYLWNKTGSIIGQTANSKNAEGTEGFTTTYAELKHKTIANHYISDFPKYISDLNFVNTTTTVFNSSELETKLIHTLNDGNKYYQGNCNTLLSTTSYKGIDWDNKIIETDCYKSFWKDGHLGDNYSEDLKQYDPVYIKYKTSPHIVFDCGGILPRLQDSEIPYTAFFQFDYNIMATPVTYSFPWLKDESIYTDKNLSKEDLNVTQPYFYLAELIKPTVSSSNIYGGVTKNAIEKITWIVASLATSTSENINKSFGDTYFQNWDYLHSYPYTREDENSVIDILTFWVETHINVEGRYDKNKLINNLLGVNENTYAKPNPVYSQLNNYFTYTILDDKFEKTDYSNQVVFSLQKHSLSEIDEWCNINLSSSFNLDGKFGKINKLITFNDTILAFQDKAVSAINYNNQTAISTESGVPIEIANSGKVNGYSIIISNTGCQNKHSICEASSGVYFIDDLNKILYRFNKEGINNISSNGMSMWFKNNLTQKERVFYDNLTNDVYITNNSNCITYNEVLQSFVSFMPYEKTKGLFNLKGKSYLLDSKSNVSTIKEMFAGNYSNNYYIEYKINPEPLIDKLFTNVEYIADCFDSDVSIDKGNKNLNLPFNRLDVWNEYQQGYTNITKEYEYPNFERKFRIWRLDIPRDNKKLVCGKALNRIRNPWINLKLSNNTNDNKMVFHNLLIKYYK